MEILTTAPNTPETIIRHILEQPTDWAAIWAAIVGPFVAALFGGGIALFIAHWRMKKQAEGLARANARALYGTLILQRSIVYPFRARLGETKEPRDIHFVIQRFSQIDTLINPSELKDPYLVDHLLLSETLGTAASYQGNVIELRTFIERHLAMYGPGGYISRLGSPVGSEVKTSTKPTMLRIADSLLENMELLRPRVFKLTGLDEDPWPSDEVLDREMASMNSDE